MYNMLSGKKLIAGKNQSTKIFHTEEAGSSTTGPLRAGTSRAGTSGASSAESAARKTRSGKPSKKPINQNWQQFDRRGCPKCKGNHPLSRCFMFRKMEPEQRQVYVKDKRFCFKCLEPHLFKNCRERNCQACGGTHHFLICPNKPNGGVWTKPPSKN